MQRLARLAKSESHLQALELLNRYDEIRTLLLRHLPPSTVALFARPIEKGEYIEWYTELEGQPVALNGTKTDEKTTALLQQRLTSVERLVTELRRDNKANKVQLELLEQLLATTRHHHYQVYLINNEPVIIGWGMMSETPPVTSVVPPTPSVYRWFWWLLSLLFITGALLWWYFQQAEKETKPIEPLITQVETKPQPKPEPIKTEEKKVEPSQPEQPKPELKKEEVKEEPKKEEPKKEEPKKEEPKKEEAKPKPEPKIEKKPTPPKEIEKVEKKTPPKERSAKTEIKPGQVWSGTYMCPQGLTSIRFDIKKFSANGEFTAIAHFKYDERRKGSVSTVGKFNNNTFIAKSVAWVKYPEVGEWLLTDFHGKYNPKTNRIEGRVIGDGCGGFELRKVR